MVRPLPPRAPAPKECATRTLRGSPATWRSLCRGAAVLLLSATASAEPAPCAIETAGWPGDQPVLDTAVARLREAAARAGLPAARSITLARSAEAAADLSVDSAALGPEGWASRRRTGGGTDRYWIVSNSPRGALYGAYALADAIERAGSLPERWEGSSVPRFPHRAWQTAAFQGNFSLPLGGGFDRPLEEIAGIVRRAIREAPRYGVNALILMGRIGEGIDAGWFVHHDEFPPLRRRPIGWGIQRRTDAIRRLAEEAHRHGLDFLIWDHELGLPDRLVEAYPEVRGTGFPVCVSQPLIWRLLRSRLAEFFRRLPEVDGLVLTFAETTGVNFLEDAGCRCDACKGTPPEERMRHVALTMREICRERGKHLVIRTYNQSPRNAELMRKALLDLPDDIVLMTKSNVVDFRGTGYPDDPMLGAFPGRPQTLELTACPEGNGFGFVPALLDGFYREKIGGAAGRGLAGVAIRIDYHLQYGHDTFYTAGPPATPFDTANEFNVVAASRLAWDPGADLDALRADWARRRYGTEAAPAVERALRRTAAITQGIFFVKGFSLLTHLDMVPRLATIDFELKNSYLLQFFPDDAGYRETARLLDAPTEEAIAGIVGEKERAIEAARQSRQEIEAARPALPAAEYDDLRRGFRRTENAARLWRHIAAVYFRLQRLKAGETRTPDDMPRLDEALGALLAECYRMEREDGIDWPLFPAARGVSGYEFAREAVERGKQGVLPAADAARFFDVWAALVEALRPGALPLSRRIDVPAMPGIQTIRFADDSLLAHLSDAGTMRLPLGAPVAGPALSAAAPARLVVTPGKDGTFSVVVEAVEKR